jgi:hypothetical protein
MIENENQEELEKALRINAFRLERRLMGLPPAEAEKARRHSEAAVKGSVTRGAEGRRQAANKATETRKRRALANRLARMSPAARELLKVVATAKDFPRGLPEVTAAVIAFIDMDCHSDSINTEYSLNPFAEYLSSLRRGLEEVASLLGELSRQQLSLESLTEMLVEPEGGAR